VRALLAARTRSDVVIGTPLYLSPEQARGAEVDGRSDLFALGALLYECVAGRPAFSGANVIEIGAQVLHFDPPPPSRFNPRVPAELDRLTLKALAKKPEDRFQTAAEFGGELARVRSRLSDSDTTRTRRLTTAEHFVRSSALTTMAEKLRRPRFSPLALAGALAAVLVAVSTVIYFMRPTPYRPPPEALLLYNRGVEAMREGAYYNASQLLTHSIEVDNKFALTHARLAEAWNELDFADRAKDELLAANSLVRERPALEREDALYLDAVSATAERKYDEAVKAYEEIARLHPQSQQVYVDLGRAYDKNNETEKAVRAFNDAASRDPSYAAAFISLCALYARQKNLPAASDAFARAEQLYTSSGNREGEAEVHYQRGRLLVDMLRYADARPELESSLELARATKNQYQQVQALLQLLYTEPDAARAQDFAREAIEIAESSGMENLAANGHIKLATLLLKPSVSDYDGAEQHLRRALDFARSYKVRRLEALAEAMLASLLSMKNRQDEALPLALQALDFYVQGNFRKEAAQTQMLIGRIKRQQGDYAGALQMFDELLAGARQSADKSQLCDVEREYGVVLLMQERYTEAVSHFGESVAAARALGNPQQLSFALASEAKALWPLERYDEARDALKEVADITSQPQNQNKTLVADSYSTEAFMLLSQGRYADAGAKARQTLAQMSGSSSNAVGFDADIALCLAEVYSGAAARGHASCDDAARVAVELGSPSSDADARMAAAEAALEAGNAQSARDKALGAEEFFARSGRAESDWRALAVAGIACRRAGDEDAAREYLSRAGALLSKLEQGLGVAAPGYLARADVRRLRSELGDASAVVSVR